MARSKLENLAYDMCQELDVKIANPELKESFRDAYSELRWQIGRLADGNFHEVVEERKP